MKPLVPGASQLVLLRARPATRKRRTSDKGYRIEEWEEWWRGGKKEVKDKGDERGKERDRRKGTRKRSNKGHRGGG